MTPGRYHITLERGGYGVLQIEIARRLGCSQSTIARVQAKRAIPHFNRSTAQRRARAMI